MKIAVIDGQGGRIGQMIVNAIKKEGLACTVRAIGTNSMATAAMLKAGADEGATGENPVIVACRQVNIIIGPLGLLVADGLLGEITPAMAAAIGQSEATKLLLPLNLCNNIVVGTQSMSVSNLISETVNTLKNLLQA
ncbi:MAG: DUF3842 family protein [Oscillospiraceae bacterium]|nr:DUF3842 family protein [Oscillospiraceae bacterium]